MPRHIRRRAGRIVANEAYRELNNLPIKNRNATRELVKWVAREYEGIKLRKAGDQTNSGNAADHGDQNQSVASERANWYGAEETLGDTEISAVVGE